MVLPPSDDEIVLQNEVVRVVVSRLSGKIVGWTELATGLPLLEEPIGIDIVGRDHKAETDLDHRPSPGGFIATVEENEALLYDPFAHGGLAVQILYRLLPEANAMEAEIAITNRTTNPISLRHIAWTGSSATFSSAAWTTDQEDRGVLLLNDLGARTTVSVRVRFSAFGDLPHTAPIRPTGALITEARPFIGTEAAFGLAESATIRVARPIRGARLFLETADGQTLEAPVDADPHRALVLPLGGLRPVGAILRSAEGVDLTARTVVESVGVISSRIPFQPWRELSEAQLGLVELDAAYRHPAALERARRATEAGEDAVAEEHLETALLYSGDDPLTWWAKAGAQRRHDPARDRDEWLNARYLRPLEPLVAAEALLAQEPASPDEEAQNPLLRLVSGREAIAAGCVAAYVEAGAFRDAIALGTRILAVQNWRRVRILMAGLYLTRTRMTMEAAEHWASAQRAETEDEIPGPVERELSEIAIARFGS